MSEIDGEPEMLQPCDEWRELIVAADAAGRWAARQLARRCSAWHLGRLGSVEIHVEPLDSPVAAWLHSTGQAVATEASTGVLIPCTITAADLDPAEDTASKARSLLVAHAYAVAYCSLLADEAGVAAEIRIVPDSMPQQPHPARTAHTSTTRSPLGNGGRPALQQ
ncbi:hypothetical protein FHX42_002285 [Saccharopolyspora lacisalsi]|uniref:Uncharacterized protein n=1 Tax=Halosaccharopolyspora lacisalsi TaxID=1000566 RepID=A0A839E1W6_9PSEU|nr:hypothetical protein [Halosaccharopolyspora lacisalsi]MBA8824938.1 hypothetical protein [Halosaccharopolyspora lacisalsi]